jgi:hypothetical protein
MCARPHVCPPTSLYAPPPPALPQAPEPSPYMGDWWCLYDYGPDHVSSWGKDHVPRFPEEVKRQVGALWVEGGKEGGRVHERPGSISQQCRVVVELAGPLHTDVRPLCDGQLGD